MYKRVQQILDENISAQCFVLAIFQIVCLWWSVHATFALVTFQIVAVMLIVGYGILLYYVASIYEHFEKRSMGDLFLTWISLYVWIAFFVIVWHLKYYWLGSAVLFFMGLLDFLFDFNQLMGISRNRLEEKRKEIERELERLRKDTL